MNRFRGWITAAGAFGIGLAVLALGLGLAGYDAPAALAALWRGSFGSWYAITSATLVRATPLIIIGLGIALAFRAGAFNIGAEGQFYAGAMAATWVGVHAAALPGPLAGALVVVLAALAGAAWVVLPVLLRVRYGVTEVISTLVLNFVAESLVSFMVLGPLQERGGIYPQSDSIAVGARLPLLPGTRLHAGIALGLGGAVLLWYVFSRTLWGFRLLAAGGGPRAAEISGRIDVARTVGFALLASAAFAGLAGGVEVAGVSYALYPSLSPGYGFTAIAVALLADLRPWGVIVTGIAFGALAAGAGTMQRDAAVPAVAVHLVEAVVIIVALLARARRRAAVAGAI